MAQNGDRYADHQPVSPYVERWYARSMRTQELRRRADPTDKMLKLFWLDKITGFILLTVDTDLRIVEQRRDIKIPCAG